MRVALYARTSTADGRQDNDNQLSQLREFAAQQGWDIVSEFVDQASAKNDKRPQFQAMFTAAKEKAFDIVLFWSLDRFSREGAFETMRYLRELTDIGVNWKSFTEQYLDSCGIFREAVLAILAVIAKQERVRLSERTLAGLERARREGKELGRPKRICNRAKIREMREGGMSLGMIAKEFRLPKANVARICKGG